MTFAELPSSLASSPSSSPRLPLELLGQNVEGAAGDGDKPEYTTLRHLCLTSKNILPFARSALYREVSVTFDDNYLRSRPIEKNSDDTAEEESSWITSDGEALTATLTVAPYLSHLVSGLTVHCNNDPRLTLEPPSHLIRSVLHRCSNICAAFAGARP